jgi:hypothetical protein
MLPASIMVNGNTLNIVSIVNVPLPTDATRTTSTITISNTSDPMLAPDYTADVQLRVSNNTTCVAFNPTRLSGLTSVFPVEWQSFTAKLVNDRTVHLNWATATEVNNEKFVVERSVDGRDFTTFGSVAGAGTSADTQQYAWVDQTLPVGAKNLYYRIQQIDFAGTSDYSEVVSVALRATSEGTLGPVVVVGDQATATFFSPTPERLIYRLFDARGALVGQGTLESKAGAENLAFQVPATPGAYFLQVSTGGYQLSRSFIRQ